MILGSIGKSSRLGETAELCWIRALLLEGPPQNLTIDFKGPVRQQRDRRYVTCKDVREQNNGYARQACVNDLSRP